MKTKKIIGLIVFCLTLVLTAGAITACGPAESGEGEVSSIEITTMPKTEYVLGEEFSVEGGELTVTYEDGTTAVVSLDAEGVEVTAPDMTTEGERKNVVVRYGGARATYSISVSAAVFTVTFDAGASTTTAEVRDGETVTKPEDPELEGSTFDGWYTAEAGGLPYDFSSPVTADMTIYAYWLEDGVTYYDFTFDYNNAVSGMESDTVVQHVAEGESAVELVTDPTRTGYEFVGWYADEEGEEAFDFSAEVTEDTTVYAQWERTSTEPVQYVFEVEDIILKDPTTGDALTGPGASGTASSTGMLVRDDGTHEVSNGYFISYLYSSGIDLRFEIVSDMAVENAQLVVRMSAEGRERSFTQDNYVISVNGTQRPEYEVTITDVPGYAYEGVACATFQDYVIGNITLREGRNYIDLVTYNDDGDAGSTRTASAPLIDCIKITTEAVLTWNTSLGYPAENY